VSKPVAPRSQAAAGKWQQHYRAAIARGDFAGAITAALAFARANPKASGPWSDAAACAVHCERWDDAIRYGQAAVQRGAQTPNACDALAHAHGAKRQWAQAAQWGLRALAMKDAATPPAPAWRAPAVLPPPPGPETRQLNLIAFSLFGSRSKYCEPAVLNAIEQPGVYPHWICHFYVDGSVPPDVVRRLRAHGAKVIVVDGALGKWPGPMWRFAALDEPGVHRVLFRDADSLIGAREAEAVAQWVESGRCFHHMRDSGSHTALMLAGTWGAVGGALPTVAPLVEAFLTRPVASQRFADQDFLARCIWPTAKQDMLCHDSIFGFMNALPFPGDGPPGGSDLSFAEGGSHVGCAEGVPVFNCPASLPEGAAVTWQLFERRGSGQWPLTSAYPAVVRNGAVSDNIPARFARRLGGPDLRFRIEAV
jgi:hypothetical protein